MPRIFHLALSEARWGLLDLVRCTTVWDMCLGGAHPPGARMLRLLALRFVTRVDELLFEALVPKRMSCMVRHTAIQVGPTKT